MRISIMLLSIILSKNSFPTIIRFVRRVCGKTSEQKIFTKFLNCKTLQDFLKKKKRAYLNLLDFIILQTNLCAI
jgi:hypothetical protein